MPEPHRFQIKEAVATSSPVVVITGALTGIDRATAVAFAHDGPRVVVSGRRDDEGQRKLATELRNLGAEAEFVRTDVRHEEESRISSTRSLLDSVASTSPSITRARRALPALLPM